jgi:aspartokinase
MPEIPINGLKLNGPLAALWVAASESKASTLAALYRLLTGNCVNIAYMTAGDAMSEEPALCCIDRTEAAKVTALFDIDPQFYDQIRVGSDVGLLTFYPHRSSLAVLGSALQLLGEHEIYIHGMASSISALSFVVAFEQLETAGTILSQGLRLPDSATPIWDTIKVQQEQRQ